jgi:uncharacterized RmlC-like cupin family protein
MTNPSAESAIHLLSRTFSAFDESVQSLGAMPQAPNDKAPLALTVAALSLIRGVSELRISCGVMKNDKDNVQLSVVEDHDGILTIRGGGPRRDWNGIHYKQGMSAKNVGTTKLSANIATIPPGGVAAAHVHVGFELILYIIEGKVRHEFGPGLKQVLENEAGDFIYIKPGVPHEVFNMSDTEPVVAFVARSSAAECDDIVPYDRNQPQ